MTMPDWRGRRVTVIGLGIEGEDMARYFVRHGARVTVSAVDAIARRVEALSAIGVRILLGSNEPSDVEGADLVCVSQGVPLSNPAVVAARSYRIAVESMTSIFFDYYPGPVVGITGSSGKTTTTSLVDAIFTMAQRPHVLGGNIGAGLLALLDDASPDRTAVLEVSHTQLQLTHRSPHVAALLNVTPNHLDQFTWDEYVALKRRIYEMQTPRDHAVFNIDDPVSSGFRLVAPGRIFLFGMSGDHGSDGAYLQNESIFWRLGSRQERVIQAADVPLRGRHNVANATAATAIAAACEIVPPAVTQAIRDFRAPAHRLELVDRVRDVDYYNDSIATAPERTLAALHSFDEPLVLLLGGREKNLPLEELMTEARVRCRAIVTFGEAGAMLADAAEAAGIETHRAGPLSEAFSVAADLAQPGDVVLLSPACTSFDAYPNFEERGVDFRRLVAQLSQEANQ
ncbi:MAG TPA: UDP-N-acetylmuramoyl-L-alanine--D-glutamate ligase [Dehalococcoidia bacterium]|nr:UDP-N-acetylmuramoyl-L-alanine--D-glutamate ligase [Dehalococcoidia bacterium]